MSSKEMKRSFSLLAFFVVTFCFFSVPLPLYVEEPGSTVDLKEMITIDDKKDQASGSFSLTSVGLRQATAARYVKAQMTPFEDVVTKEQVFGHATSEEYDQVQKYFMESSKNTAIEQGLKLAKEPYQLKYQGVYVLSIDAASDFAQHLAVGDIITAVDGQKFESSAAFIQYVQSKKTDETIKVTYLREQKEQTVEGKLMKLANGNAGIGIQLVDQTSIETSKNIQIETHAIGGPSAGLMFTLEIYEQLTQQDLRKGHKVAGTGTINTQGEVGRIGGIDKKVASASKAGMEIFFAPDDEISQEMRTTQPGLQSNYAEAKAAAEKLNTSMKIVPVKTVDDALAYLKTLKM